MHHILKLLFYFLSHWWKLVGTCFSCFYDWFMLDKAFLCSKFTSACSIFLWSINLINMQLKQMLTQRHQHVLTFQKHFAKILWHSVRGVKKRGHFGAESTGMFVFQQSTKTTSKPRNLLTKLCFLYGCFQSVCTVSHDLKGYYFWNKVDLKSLWNVYLGAGQPQGRGARGLQTAARYKRNYKLIGECQWLTST